MSIYQRLRIYDTDKKHHLIFSRNRYLAECVKGQSTLHVGCSDFPVTADRLAAKSLLHAELLDSARDVLGIDLSLEGINLLKEHGFGNVFVMDAEDMRLAKNFDVIVAGDVLEHLSNPGKFLERAVELLKSNGQIIIGVPSALTVNNIRPWLSGSELIHRDHTFYFSPKSLSTLCERYALLPTRLVFTVQAPEIGERKTFVLLRKLILTRFSAMSPSFIMHFQKRDEVDRKTYFEWK